MNHKRSPALVDLVFWWWCGEDSNKPPCKHVCRVNAKEKRGGGGCVKDAMLNNKVDKRPHGKNSDGALNIGRKQAMWICGGEHSKENER